MDNTLYQMIVAHTTDGVLCINPEGKILFLNRAGEDLLGKKESEILHQPYNEHFKDNAFTHFALTELPTQGGKVLLFRKKGLAKELVHDIRNPLSGIRGFAELLLRDVKDQPNQARMVKNIIRGADELDDLLKENS